MTSSFGSLKVKSSASAINRRLIVRGNRSPLRRATQVGLAMLVLLPVGNVCGQADSVQVLPFERVHIEYAQQDRLAIVYAVQTPDGIHWGVDPESAAAIRPVSDSPTKSTPASDLVVKLPVQVRQVDQQLQISRATQFPPSESGEADDVRIRVLTFQRRGEQAAYGVYGLHREKRLVSADLPLDGVPINWPSRTAREATAHLFGLSGLDDRFAENAVAAHWEKWGAPGLRVLLVCSARKAAIFPGVELRDSTQVVCIVWELRLPPEPTDR